MEHISSLSELNSNRVPVLLGQWHHLILQFINKGLADLSHNHNDSAVHTSEAVVEGGILVCSHQVSQGEDQLQSSIQELSQVGVLLLDDWPNPLKQVIAKLQWHLHIVGKGDLVVHTQRAY